MVGTKYVTLNGLKKYTGLMKQTIHNIVNQETSIYLTNSFLQPSVWYINKGNKTSVTTTDVFAAESTLINTFPFVFNIGATNGFCLAPNSWEVFESGSINAQLTDIDYLGVVTGIRAQSIGGQWGVYNFSVTGPNPSINLQQLLHCFPENTMITLANGEKKPIQEITSDDDILVWNFDEGHFDTAKPLVIQLQGETTEINRIIFENGQYFDSIGNHRLFHVESGSFKNCEDGGMKLGEHSFNSDGKKLMITEKKKIYKKVKAYNLITDYHMNCFANSILSSQYFNNIYPVEDMKFNKEGRKLLSKELFSKAPDKLINGLRLREQDKKFYDEWLDKEVYGTDDYITFINEEIKQYIPLMK